jgi:hypothetical protein
VEQSNEAKSQEWIEDPIDPDDNANTRRAKIAPGMYPPEGILPRKLTEKEQ